MDKKQLHLMAILVSCLLLLFSNNVRAQRPPEPVNPQKDKMDYQGYTIRLMPALPTGESIGSYGFDILKNNKPVVHQFQSPLSTTRKGIQKKEDAYKIAQWMIREFKKNGHWRNMVPPHIANELKIQND